MLQVIFLCIAFVAAGMAFSYVVIDGMSSEYRELKKCECEERRG